MRKIFVTLTVITAIIAGSITACTRSAARQEKETVPIETDQLKRGEYLVNIVGCDDCHSPKRMGAHGPEIIPERRLSGYNATSSTPPVDTNTLKKGWVLLAPDLTAAAGPWGVSYAANITSDATGIGNWDEENFIRAIREGKSKGISSNRDILPPMPWFVYRNMTDEDLKAIFAYLKTTKPVVNSVPQPVAYNKIK